MTASEKIKKIMQQQGINQRDLARLIGQSEQNLHNKFKRGNFPEKELQKIAQALGCDVSITFTLPDGKKI